MTRLLWLSLSMLLLLAPPAHAQWSHEPPGSTVLTDWGFNALAGSGWENNGGSHQIGSDGTAPISPPNVYQQNFWVGMPAGVSPAGDTYRFPAPISEAYLGFRWKASAGFQQHSSNRTKILFLSTTQTNSLFFYMGGEQGTTYCIGMQYQNSNIDNGHISGFPGVPGTFDIPSGGCFTVGSWVDIQLYVKRSTTTTSQNGILRFWVNGVLAREFTNMNFEPYDFQFVPIVPIWGGVGGSVTTPGTFSYDHIRVSAPNCPGTCGGGGGTTPPPPPPLPPNKVTNLRVQ